MAILLDVSCARTNRRDGGSTWVRFQTAMAVDDFFARDDDGRKPCFVSHALMLVCLLFCGLFFVPHRRQESGRENVASVAGEDCLKRSVQGVFCMIVCVCVCGVTKFGFA